MNAFKDAFDAIEADETLKMRTAQAVSTAMKKDPRKRLRQRLLPVLAAVCLLAAVGLGGHHLYTTPTTVLSIDINPSLEMEINRFDRVIAVRGYNADGEVLAENLDVRGERYHEAIDAFMNDATVTDCLARGEELSIAVVQTERGDVAQNDAVLDYITSCTARHANVHCYSTDSNAEQMSDAHEAGLSCGKYNLYQTLRRAGISITPEEVRSKSVRELEALLRENNAGDGTTPSPGMMHEGGHHGMMHE